MRRPNRRIAALFGGGLGVAAVAVAGATWARDRSEPPVRTSSDAEIRIAEPVPASPPGRPTATAAVDERDIYGLRLFGVPVRTAPRVDADQVATAHHGDVLEATCWAEGDELSTGFPEQPLADAYRSTLWFKVRIDGVEGFIPDARFSRSAATGRLNLPPC